MSYSGVLTIDIDNDELLADFYTNRMLCMASEPYINQYLVIRNNGKLLGPYKFKNGKWEDVPFRVFESLHFGSIKPKDNDPYQRAYMDSLVENDLTFCTGPGGTGKSLIAMSYAFQEFEKGHIDKIVVFTNPLIATGAVKLGFLPGTKQDKLLESSIGSILISKLGGEDEVRRLMDRDELVLMPMGDCRGYEVPTNAFVYFTEAQNMSPYLMKLFLQRTNDSSKICVEGDVKQSDYEVFYKQSGLQKAIDVFRGEDYAGHVELRTIYRGRIARKAEEICD